MAGEGVEALDLAATLASWALLPLDDRFLRGRGCALPLASGPVHAQKGGQGILELEASWAIDDPPRK